MSATLEEELRDIETNPCTSFWLKKAVRELMQRDCLDASVDAEILHRVMQKVVARNCAQSAKEGIDWLVKETASGGMQRRENR